eukprot:7852537-Karenia_brevis.AAC.1
MLARAVSGSHKDHTASAHMPIGPMCASNAGSVLPFGPPSARMSVRPKAHLPPGIEAAAVADRWLWSMVLATPVLATP